MVDEGRLFSPLFPSSHCRLPVPELLMWITLQWGRGKGAEIQETKNPLWFGLDGIFPLQFHVYHLVLSWDHKMVVQGKICHKLHSEFIV